MSGIDPRINSPLDSSTINGRMTDRAIELIGMLNKVIGAEGLGNRTFTITGELGDLEQTLSHHLVERNVDDPAWKETEQVYFGTTNDRLDLIQATLAENLESIKSDIADNVSGLFSILNDKKGLLDNYEKAIQDAKTVDEIIKAEQDLERELEKVLSSDETLNEIINNFFESAEVQLTDTRIDEEIFNLLNDYDNNYSNGSTDKSAQMFLVTLPNRPGMTGTRPSQILSNIEDVLDLVLLENKEVFEESNGEGSYSQDNEKTFVKNQVLGNFRTGKLKLGDEIINAIIDDLNLDDQLDSIDSMSDFLDLIDQEKLLELAANVYTEALTEEEILKELFKDHLQITTPKYYKDQRTLSDILTGKGNNSDFSNENKIFNSIGKQIKRVSSAAIDLFGYGYEKVTGTNLHESIRRSPISTIEFLEVKKAELNGEELKNVQNLIDNFIDKQAQALEFFIEQEEKRPKTERNKDLIKDLKKVLKAVDKYNGNTSKIKEEINKGSPELQDLLGDMPDIDPSLDLKIFTDVLDEVINLPNIHIALYGNELREANKINAQYTGRKLPNFKQDGTPPEDNAIAPPSIGPSPLAGVLAKIGDVLMQKAHNLEKDADVPNEDWMNENVDMLKTINDKLPTLGMGSAGEAFIDSLRENFKDIIKNFFDAHLDKKLKKDQSRTNLEKADSTTNDLAFLIDNNVIDKKTKISELVTLVDTLDNIDYPQEINNRTTQIGFINSQIAGLEDELTNPDLTQEEIDTINTEITRLNTEVSTLSSEIISLSRDSEILDAGLEVLETLDGVQDNKKVADEFEKKLKDLEKQYKDDIINYSDSITDFTADSDGDGETDIEKIFKDSLDQAKLDLDENGQNDFLDITGIIDKIGGLSNNIKNIYGGTEATLNAEGKTKGIEDQSIRRLILLMFVFSMLEAGEWDYRRYEADTSRYQVV